MDDATKKIVTVGLVAAVAGGVVAWAIFRGRQSMPTAADTMSALEDIKTSVLAESRRDLESLFDELDTNNDGQLDREELAAGLEGEKGAQLMKRLRACGLKDVYVFEQLDTDRSGTITKLELMSAFGTEIRLAQVFDRCDVDKDGSLSKAEIMRSLREDMALWNELVAFSKDSLNLFARMDRDGDGRITLREFIEAFHEGR